MTFLIFLLLIIFHDMVDNQNGTLEIEHRKTKISLHAN